MNDYVIIRTSDETGVSKVYGPYSFEAADLVANSCKDRDKFTYNIYLLRSTRELR